MLALDCAVLGTSQEIGTRALVANRIECKIKNPLWTFPTADENGDRVSPQLPNCDRPGLPTAFNAFTRR